MKLKIPQLRQDENSKDCGLICMLMVMRYYGDDKTTYEDLKQALVVDEIGTYAPQMGTYLLNQGYKVELIGLNPGLFSTLDKGASTEEIQERLAEKLELADKERDVKVIKYFQEFLDNSGSMKVQIPSEDHLQYAIEQETPVIALLTSNFLNRRPELNFHFNVVTGITHELITVNDPLWDERGGEHQYIIEDYLYAIHASAAGDLDNATLMRVWKD